MKRHVTTADNRLRQAGGMVARLASQRYAARRGAAHLPFFPHWLGVLILACLLLTATAPVRAAPAKQSQSDALAACEALTESAVRDELNRISQSIFSGADATADLTTIVERQWIALDLDSTVDDAVAEAVIQVQGNEQIIDTILSGWSPAKAEELTSAVATAAFSSETMRKSLDELADAIAADIEGQIGELAAESTTRNLACLQQFIEQHYSDAVLSAFQGTIRADGVDFADSPGQGLDAGIMTVLEQHKPAIGGIGVIIAAQISRKVLLRMGRSVSRRLAGRVATRLLGRVGATVIPLAGWIIGGGLIAYDLMESLDGALPQIEQSLTTPDVKEAIRAEIVRSIEPELRRELPELARDVANDLYTEWLDFKRQYRQVLELAERDADFALLLSTTDNLPGLADLLDAALTTLGVDGAAIALRDGSFAQMAALPAPGAAILRDTGSPATVLAWQAAAGSRLADVADLQLHMSSDATDWSPELLAQLLTLQDRTAAHKLAAVEPAALAGLFAVSSRSLTELATRFPIDQLVALGHLLSGLDEPRRNELVTALLNNPTAAETLTRGSGTALLSARSIAGAVAFLSTPADAVSYGSDLLSLGRGAISYRLFAAKYGTLVALTTVLVPLLIVFGVAYSLATVVVRPIRGLARLFSRRER